MRVVVLLLAGLLAAPRVFRSATDVVEVDVDALDKDGHFVTDGRADDFEVREDGTPQLIDVMHFVGDGTMRTVAEAATAPAPATNAGPPRGLEPAPRRMFFAVFDNDHLTPAGFKRVHPVSHFNAAKGHELRYAGYRRTSPVKSTTQWFANRNDRDRAVAEYRKYLELAPQGPFAESAREALTRLDAK